MYINEWDCIGGWANIRKNIENNESISTIFKWEALDLEGTISTKFYSDTFIYIWFSYCKVKEPEGF